MKPKLTNLDMTYCMADQPISDCETCKRNIYRYREEYGRLLSLMNQPEIDREKSECALYVSI